MTETYGPLLIARGETDIGILPKMANRHGLVAGATGTGKTVTLRVLAEHFSSIGVPIFMADVKGDLSGLCQPGGEVPKIAERVEDLKLKDFKYQAYPVVFWDPEGVQGHPVRTTISEMGPLLLSRLLNLNDTQSGVLTLIFKIADDNGLLLLDLKDLQAMAQYAGDNADQFRTSYGNVSSASVGAIQRSLLVLEQQKADKLFGEPALNLDDLIQTSAQGQGVINILVADQLIQAPSRYATFLLWLLSDLFERLPEVGDPPKPKLIFFFDEAHLLFEDAPKALVDKIEQVVRLIRSKGVGVFFVTQNPLDLPDRVLGQLGNRVQHALRAFTPRDQKNVKAAADTFRAAAVEQLEIWGERVGAQVVKQKTGSDPAAVVFDGLDAAQARGVDVVYVDTAGRLHTKVNLMEELKKIHRTAAKKMPGAPHEILLILDATTGQNALNQARLFHEAVGVTGVVLTKLDGTAKGGMALAVAHETGLPLRYVGVGEGMDDLQPFDPEAFVAAILD